MSNEGLRKIIKFIEDHDVQAEILTFKKGVDTVASASKTSGVNPDKILKTLIIMVDKKPYAMILSGNRKLDFKKIKKILNAKNVRLATRLEIKNLIGLEPGEVSPLLEELLSINRIVDSHVLRKNVVLAGGGTKHTLVRINVKELIRVINPIIADVSK